MDVSRRNSGAGGSSVSLAAVRLQAWGPVADSRWKELLAIVEADDQSFLVTSKAPSPSLVDRSLSPVSATSRVLPPKNASESATSPPKLSGRDKIFGNSSDKAGASRSGSSDSRKASATTGNVSSSTSKKPHRRRPLLILFAKHNQPEPLAAYRAIILAERFTYVVFVIQFVMLFRYRWFRRPKKVDKLSLSADHLHSLPRLPRAAVAELILNEAVLPLLRTYVDIGMLFSLIFDTVKHILPLNVQRKMCFLLLSSGASNHHHLISLGLLNYLLKF